MDTTSESGQDYRAFWTTDEARGWTQTVVAQANEWLKPRFGEPNNGRVLIEKFEQTAAAVGYAIVLLTGDDVGRPAATATDRPRARQNVVFEMGFFVGAFGRPRVAVLVEEGVERPSDIEGLVDITLDAAGAWKTKVATELDSAGLSINWAGLRAV